MNTEILIHTVAFINDAVLSRNIMAFIEGAIFYQIALAFAKHFAQAVKQAKLDRDPQRIFKDFNFVPVTTDHKTEIITATPETVNAVTIAPPTIHADPTPNLEVKQVAIALKPAPKRRGRKPKQSLSKLISEEVSKNDSSNLVWETETKNWGKEPQSVA